MQTLFEDAVDRLVGQIGVGIAHQRVAFAFAAMKPGKCRKITAQFGVAESEAARKAIVEDQELANATGIDPSRVEPAVGAVAGDRSQDRVPLPRIEAGPDIGQRGQEQVVFDVENAGGFLDEAFAELRRCGVLVR